MLLVDENASLGGSLNYSRLDAEGTAARELRQRLVAEVEATANITAMTSATCNAWFADNWLPIICGKRLYKVRAKQTILCVGSMEQQAVFHNNDLPGVIMSSAAQRLMHLYGVRPGNSAVVLTGNNEGYGTALDLLDAGVEVKAVIDLRHQPEYDAVAKYAVSKGLEVKTGCAVYAANKDPSGLHLGSVEVREIIVRVSVRHLKVQGRNH